MKSAHCTDELIEEVAKRVGVTTLAVNEVLIVLFDAPQKPWGKFHVQICTNISCLLWDGDKLWEHACQKLGIGHKRSHGRRPDFARRSRMHRRLLLGARRSGQLRFPSLRDARKARSKSSTG